MATQAQSHENFRVPHMILASLSAFQRDGRHSSLLHGKLEPALDRVGPHLQLDNPILWGLASLRQSNLRLPDVGLD